MENTQNNITNYSSSDNKKTVLVTIVVGIIVLSVLIWWMRGTSTPQQVGVSPTPDAEAAAINQSVDDINVGDLNAEFEAIDKDLRGL
ncbi:MAG: hypothetical protein AAB941_01675 [Patescibacteria group bacterium]